MPNDPYYRTSAWLALRRQCLTRDRYRCVVCGHPAVVVDRIVSRREGGRDVLSNLRSLCRAHDNQTKEDARGTRRSGGRLKIFGCDEEGNPLDLNHPWFK